MTPSHPSLALSLGRFAFLAALTLSIVAPILVGAASILSADEAGAAAQAGDAVDCFRFSQVVNTGGANT